MTESTLFAKYDVPVPRYTSYPTVPRWHASPTPERWVASLRDAAARPDASVAVYVHLPFCQSLCTYCGCNTVITRDHGRAAPYVELVLAELGRYLDQVPALTARPLRQVHLGGGTPTFLSADSLARLLDGILDRWPRQTADFEGAIEVDPRVTTVTQLETVRRRGFRRVSLGVQDIDPEVQHLVNRHQPPDVTATLCEAARRLDFDSINVDLIYGLPMQTPESMERLMPAVLAWRPDRLAVYSFARVPWIKPQQRRFTDDQIPVGAAKRVLYEVARRHLTAAGYVEIGLDHFALPTDALARVAEEGRLHRNFMGYTDVATTIALGLGVSAISETPDCYHQNEKVITRYERRVTAGEIPTLRGHLLSGEDQRCRDRIAQVMTRFRVQLEQGEAADYADALQPLAADGLIRLDGDRLSVLPAGRPFLRNVASVFDAYLAPDPSGAPMYSTSA